MQFTTLFTLAALAIGQATAGTLNHRHFHRRSPVAVPIELAERSTLSTAATSLLSSLKILTGSNAASSNGAAWLGADGPFVNTFINNSTEPVVLVLWGASSYQASFVGTVAPLITSSIPAGSSQDVSFANGVSGAWTAVYPDTTMTKYGQISQTWGEYTFNGQYTTVDVSREVSMTGRGMRIETPTCVSDMTTCVFVCTDGTDSCLTAYKLQNCDAGSQAGAQSSASGTDGGCSPFTGPSGTFKTYLY